MRAIGLHIAVLALAAVAGNEPLWAAPRAQPDDLQFAVAAENVGASLLVRGSIKNKRVTPVTVGFGMCFSHNVRMRLYRAPERRPPAVWDSADNLGVCRLALLVAPISARSSISPPELAGEVSEVSVPDGTYFATASILLSEPRMESDEMPAGAIVVRSR